MCDDKFSQLFVALMAHFTSNLSIIKINECLVVKNLLTNVTKTNEHSNVTTFVHALIAIVHPYYSR